MAVNMCRRDFGSVVTTTAVCADGYEVENLLGKTNMWGQPKGFLVECFVKPPVDVTFMFPLNVCVQRILIEPKVGGQMSTAVEVFAASVSMPPCQEGPSRSALKGKSRSSKLPGQKPSLRSQSQMMSEKDTAVFSSIGKAFSVDGATSCFCFVNHGYQPMYPQIRSGGPRQEDTKPGVVLRSLRYAQPGALTNVSHITLRINRAASVVAIKSVQVWGQPSRVCSKPAVQWFLQVANPVENPSNRPRIEGEAVAGGEQNGASHSTAPPGRKTRENCKRTADPPDCPEEFLDPITNEMLVLPILLPSGHTVDSETLRKHGEAEALWGRPPNDPFTGIPFSKGRQPLPNVKLKQRLDRYLLTGGGKVAPPARDVGRSGGMAAGKSVPSPASLVRTTNQESTASCNTDSGALQDTQPDEPQEFQSSGRHCGTSSRRYTSMSTGNLTSQASLIHSETLRFGRGSKRKLKDHSLDGKSVNKKKTRSCMLDNKDLECGQSWASAQMSNLVPSSSSSLLSSSPASTTAARAAAAGAAAAGAARASTSSHEELLAQSLDAALESALSSSPSFSKQPEQQSGYLADNLSHKWSCLSCHKTLATKKGYHVDGPLNMYSLPCNHIICRDCLSPGNDQTSGKCRVCDRKFRHSEVTKVHV